MAQDRPGAQPSKPPAVETERPKPASPPKVKTQASTEAKEEEKPPQLKYVGRTVSLVWDEAGKPRMRATAHELTGNTVAGTASMKRVNAELYENGKLVAKLSAPLVLADEKTRVITATGGVKMISAVPNSSIRTIRADWVKWYSRENKVVGNGGIIAQGPVTSIKAAAFIADTRLRTVRILADPREARAIIGKR